MFFACQKEIHLEICYFNLKFSHKFNGMHYNNNYTKLFRIKMHQSHKMKYSYFSLIYVVLMHSAHKHWIL